MNRRQREKWYRRMSMTQSGMADCSPWWVHSSPKDCPLYYDGCWCIPKRAGAALRRARREAVRGRSEDMEEAASIAREVEA